MLISIQIHTHVIFKKNVKLKKKKKKQNRKKTKKTTKRKINKISAQIVQYVKQGREQRKKAPAWSHDTWLNQLTAQQQH